MRASQFFFPTLKENPKDAYLPSHQLMLRSGMIKRVSAGIYTWLPLGLRVLSKVTQIIREEMNRCGAQELLMPAIQPQELWEETDRWELFGNQLIRFIDQCDRAYCLGPTHEEVITDIIRSSIKSYKQLPLTLYQIQTKYRDEIRPRFGVMRAREFSMKDAYSFSLTEEDLDKTYKTMYDAYTRIYTRLGFTFRAVLADSGNIGGKLSHEFQVLADNGEDYVFYSDGSDYAANMELATYKIEKPEPLPDNAPEMILDKLSPAKSEVHDKTTTRPENWIKTFVVRGVDVPAVAICMLKEDYLNELKVEKHPQVSAPIEYLERDEIIEITGCSPDFVGPHQSKIPVLVDHRALHAKSFTIGSNQDGHLLCHANWDRDITNYEAFDCRNVVVGDPSPDGKGTLQCKRGIEVGHIFQLGTKYSEQMNTTVLDKNGKAHPLIMGCYGIGVSRIVAALVEQHHDENGPIWPEVVAPFTVSIICLSPKSESVIKACEKLYDTLQAEGIEVYYDDRDERAGRKFAENDLLGIPHRLVLSERLLGDNSVEYKHRASSDAINISVDEIETHIRSILNKDGTKHGQNQTSVA